MVQYRHSALKRLEELEPLNSPPLHEKVYTDLLLRGLEFHKDREEEFEDSIALLRGLCDIHNEYIKQSGLFSDMFGEYMEERGQTSAKEGQFFTPPNIVDMIVAMQFNECDLSQSAPYTICDPACGSGRFMLGTAKHFVEKNYGCLNFLFTGIDVDRRMFTFCTMNAVLNAIPAIIIHGNTLTMEIWDAFVTTPIGPASMWHRLSPERAKSHLVRSLGQDISRSAAKTEKPASVQTSLEVGG